jgi:hypothetical protein
MGWFARSMVAAQERWRGPEHVKRHSRLLTGAGIAVILASGVLGTGGGATPAAAKINPTGELDCNGFSQLQNAIHPMNCTDIRGIAGVTNANTWGGRFYDNGHYIGHDEPDVTFLSTRPGSGDNVTWTETLGTDPAAMPTVATPGKDVTHWFELSPAPWFSMAMCDSNSYPQLPCVPQSDGNAAACPNAFGCPYNLYPGAGSAFMELQFYPPGNAPFVDNESCNNTYWCAALTIDSLECTYGFAQCNLNCEEPVNFAFIQTNGVPTGAPSPQKASVASFTPNSDTLMMNPGDRVTVHMADAPVPGGGGANAFKVTIDDLTTHQSGYMQASAANGFMNTSIVDCSGTPYNFEPEYNTASQGNIVPWAALQTDISTEFETGHFEPCTSLSSPFASNPFDPADQTVAYNVCSGPYETAGPAEGSGTSNPEAGDALCYLAGSTHNGYDGPGTSTPPNEVTGCQDNVFQNGDLDFDGTPYYPDWPTSTSAGKLFPGSFVESLPSSENAAYSQYIIQTDVALSESTCTGTAGCTVPPSGPGNFYPYWSTTSAGGQDQGPGQGPGQGPSQGPGQGQDRGGPGSCSLLFGNVSGRGINTMGGDAQFGTNLFSKLGYPEFESQPQLVSGLCGQ